MILRLKNQVVYSVVGALAIALAVAGWQLNRLSNQLEQSRQDVRSYESALKTTTESLSQVREDMRRLERILSQREQDRREIERETNQLLQELQNERQRSETFDACYDVLLSDDYLERLHQNHNRDED